MRRTEIAIKRSAEERGIRGPSPRGDYSACCPFCITVAGKEDEKFKLSINPAKGVFHCYRCETGGKGEFKWLNDPLVSRGAQPEAPPEPLPPEHFYPMSNNSTSVALRPYVDYLKRRDLSDMEIDSNRIGACLAGKYAGRIIVPHLVTTVHARRKDQEWAGFSARTIYPSVEPRYLYPRGMKRKELIWGLHQPPTEDLYVTEGVFDALALAPFGVCTYGKNVTDEQLDLLAGLHGRGHGVERIIFAFDGDAWRDGMVAAMRLQLRDPQVKKVTWARLPPGRDPGNLGLEGVRNCIQHP